MKEAYKKYIKYVTLLAVLGLTGYGVYTGQLSIPNALDRIDNTIEKLDIEKIEE